MKTLLWISLFTLNLSQTALACECTEPGKLKAAIKESNQIFLGKVLSISDEPSDPSFFWVKFKVQKSWKGPAKKQTRIKVASGKACGYAFAKGKDYLVFSSNQMPYTSACGWTKSAAAASSTVTILGRPRFRS